MPKFDTSFNFGANRKPKKQKKQKKQKSAKASGSQSAAKKYYKVR